MAYFRYANKLKKDDEPSSIVLLHFEDDFINDQITDAKGNVFIKSGSDIAISDDYKFGEHSIYMTNYSYIQSQNIPSLYFGTGDFTMDFWVKPTKNDYRMCPVSIFSGGIIVDLLSLTPRMWWLNSAGNAWVMGDNNSGLGTERIKLNEWSHVAYVRNGNKFILFVNGKVSKITDFSGELLEQYRNIENVAVRVGMWDTRSYPLTGNVDEVRIINKAVWTEEFTPPTAPYKK